MHLRRFASALWGALLFFSSGCTGSYLHIAPRGVTPATQPRSVTEAAYLWGIIQPNDIVPTNCPDKVPLAEVTAETNLGYVLVEAVTLGIVVIQRIEWRCANPPGGQDTHVLGADGLGRKG
jgi:hypothetical protein